MRKRELQARVDELVEESKEQRGRADAAQLLYQRVQENFRAAHTAVAVLRREVHELRERPDPIRDHLLKHRVIVNLKKGGGSVRGICLDMTPEFIHLAEPEFIPEGREDSAGKHDYPGFIDRANVAFYLLDR